MLHRTRDWIYQRTWEKSQGRFDFRWVSSPIHRTRPPCAAAELVGPGDLALRLSSRLKLKQTHKHNFILSSKTQTWWSFKKDILGYLSKTWKGITSALEKADPKPLKKRDLMFKVKQYHLIEFIKSAAHKYLTEMPSWIKMWIIKTSLQFCRHLYAHKRKASLCPSKPRAFADPGCDLATTISQVSQS